MRSILIALAGGLTLALATAGTALAGNGSGGPLQSATNSIAQSSSAKAVSLNLSPNVAMLDGGDVQQSSGSSASASATNANRSAQENGQSQSGGSSSGRDQTASNSIDQTASAKAVSVNASPNVAVLDGGDVQQSSGSSASAGASNANESWQGNEQRQSGGSSCGCGGDSKQSQSASDSVDQTAHAKAVSLNASPNVAVGNGLSGKKHGLDGCGCNGPKRDSGVVKQSSGSSASAGAADRNSSWQGNGQSRTSRGSCCGGRSSRSQDASNSVSQQAGAKSYAFDLAPNVAFLNRGDVYQSSGAWAWAGASDWNRSGQFDGQVQKGGGSCGCRSGSTQSRSASNAISQDAFAKAFAFDFGPNFAFLNRGDANQSSGASAGAAATDWNRSWQGNEQRRTGRGGRPCHCE